MRDGADGIARTDIQLGLGQVGVFQPTLHHAHHRQAAQQHHDGPEHRRRSQQLATNIHAAGQRLQPAIQNADVAVRRHHRGDAQHYQQYPQRCRQQHPALFQARVRQARGQAQRATDRAARRQQPQREIIGELHQQRCRQHHHRHPHHLLGSEHGEVEIAQQRRRKRSEHRQMSTQPRQYQPAAARCLGSPCTPLVFLLLGFGRCRSATPVQRGQRHQHAHDQGDVGQCDQAIKGDRTHLRGARSAVDLAQHHGEPGQPRCPPGKTTQPHCGQVIDVEQAP
ncbi:hypothetical protein D3C71_697250 [compost metagenome]